jgi:hypothetical protein
MKQGIITFVFGKGSKWKGKLCPSFDKKSEQKLFKKKRARTPPGTRGIKRYRSGKGVKPLPEQGCSVAKPSWLGW